MTAVGVFTAQRGFCKFYGFCPDFTVSQKIECVVNGIFPFTTVSYSDCYPYGSGKAAALCTEKDCSGIFSFFRM